jgi:hypothetical protein
VISDRDSLSWSVASDSDSGDVVFYGLSIVDSLGVTVLGQEGMSSTWYVAGPSLRDSSRYVAAVSAIDGHLTEQATLPATVEFAVDKTAPSGQVLYPTAGSIVPGATPLSLRFDVSDWSGPTTAVALLSTDGGTTYPDTLYAGAYADSLPWIAPAIQSEQCRVRLVVRDMAGNVATMESDSLFTLYGISTDVGGVAPPTSFSLQVRPQPARTGATIGFDLPIQTAVRLEVFDVAGRNVRLLAAGQYAPGSYSLPWDLRRGDGSRLSAGVFFVRLQAGGQSRLSRMVIVQ